MADISKIKPNGSSGTEYDIKDATARSALENKANNTQTFTEASTRANIASGETMSTLFGKIKKFFTDLKTVAFTGSYNDLSNKPTIPAAQVQSNWTQTTTTAVDYIKNKPTIPAAVAVKGNAESSYRTGNVNLTPANIGAATVSDAQTAGRDAALTYVTANAVPKATADADGNVISSTYSKTDEKVKQENTTTNAEYRILFSNGANDTTETKTARKNTNLKYNPSTKILTADSINAAIKAGGKIRIYNDTGTNYVELISDTTANRQFILPNSGSTDTLATREYLNSNLGWKKWYSSNITPTSTNTDYTVTAGISSIHEVMVALYYGQVYRQTIIYPAAHADGSLIFPDFYWAGSRLYFQMTKVSDTKIRIGSAGSSGSISWSNCQVTLYYR